MPEPLHWRTAKVHRFLCEYIGTYGYAPTADEIGQAVGLASRSSVVHQLGVLQRLGYIERGPRYSARTIRLLRGPDGTGGAQGQG